MDTWQEIESLGFYPALVTRTLRRGLGGREPLASVCQLDAAFDATSMFRHLTVTALTDAHLVQVHVDEQDDGAATVTTTMAAVSRIQGVSVVELVPAPSAPDAAGAPSEVSIFLNIGAQRRGELWPQSCDDPECTADHGYVTTSVPDDLTVGFTAADDGASAVDRAEQFVTALTSVLAAAHG